MVLSYFPCSGLVGLYEYTVQTNNAVEGTNMVSIGFHYVAADTNGDPLDAFVDGTPDYLDDAGGLLAVWKMSWFEQTGVDMTTNLDVYGKTWLFDYENAMNPNVVGFTVRLGNQ